MKKIEGMNEYQVRSWAYWDHSKVLDFLLLNELLISRGVDFLIQARLFSPFVFEWFILYWKYPFDNWILNQFCVPSIFCYFSIPVVVTALTSPKSKHFSLSH